MLISEAPSTQGNENSTTYERKTLLTLASESQNQAENLVPTEGDSVQRRDSMNHRRLRLHPSGVGDPLAYS